MYCYEIPPDRMQAIITVVSVFLVQLLGSRRRVGIFEPRGWDCVEDLLNDYIFDSFVQGMNLRNRQSGTMNVSSYVIELEGGM